MRVGQRGFIGKTGRRVNGWLTQCSFGSKIRHTVSGHILAMWPMPTH